MGNNKSQLVVAAIENGTVIDHIPAEKTYQVVNLLQLEKMDTPVTIGYNLPSKKIGRKIRDNELKRVPYMVIVGEKESAEGLVSMRKQGGGEQATMSMEEFAQRINAEVAEQLKAAEE